MLIDQEIDSIHPTKVLLFAGSLRQNSDNKKLIKETAIFATQLGSDVTVIDLKNYPFYFYDEDEEEIFGMPENAKKIRDLMIESQIIFIASPNYNNSFPALVKNILDWTSRNEEAEASREAFKGKTFALMSAGYGSKGGVKGLPHLRAVIANIGGTVIKEEFGVPDAYDAFDEQGLLIDPELKAKLFKFVENTLRAGSKPT
ncbi:MAG: NAD(P)H-dependent oxidoreductase [Parachlamydiaceae bacterium]|nr:NAD(P)H-dependent oxidoreductase [Parachlamydiaceae bacterium]